MGQPVFDASAVTRMGKRDKALLIRKLSEFSHVSPRKLRALYLVLGDDLFFMFFLLADDEVRFPSVKELRKLIGVIKRSDEEGSNVQG